MAIIETEGPLQGMACVSVVVGKRETEWLQHASEFLNLSIEDLVRIAAEEAALKWSKDQGLLK